jgi:hypothetical protein
MDSYGLSVFDLLALLTWVCSCFVLQAYLSLPEGTASVVGLIAMMTDYYNVLVRLDLIFPVQLSLVTLLSIWSCYIFVDDIVGFDFNLADLVP